MAVQDQLQPGEEVVYVAHVTRISLIPWVVVLALVIAGGAVAYSFTGEMAISIATVVGGGGLAARHQF